MKLYTIAIRQNVCGGHGDNYVAESIQRTGMYGSGSFPPVFSQKERALGWLLANPTSSAVVVEMELDSDGGSTDDWRNVRDGL